MKTTVTMTAAILVAATGVATAQETAMPDPDPDPDLELSVAALRTQLADALDAVLRDHDAPVHVLDFGGLAGRGTETRSDGTAGLPAGAFDAEILVQEDDTPSRTILLPEGEVRADFLYDARIRAPDSTVTPGANTTFGSISASRPITVS